MTQSTKNTVKSPLKKMRLGDGLRIYHPSNVVLQVALLRRIGELFFLSMPAENTYRHTLAPNNPYRWDESLQTLVGYNECTPQWWSPSFDLERGVAQEASRRYNVTPRFDIDNVFTLTEAMLQNFRASDLPYILDGLGENGEGGSPINTLCLALRAIGINATDQQIFALEIFIATLTIQRAVAMLNDTPVHVITMPEPITPPSCTKH